MKCPKCGKGELFYSEWLTSARDYKFKKDGTLNKRYVVTQPSPIGTFSIGCSDCGEQWADDEFSFDEMGALKLKTESNFEAGQTVIYQNGGTKQFGKIKRIDEDGRIFVWYSEGDTAACTPVKYLSRYNCVTDLEDVSNKDAIKAILAKKHA